MKTVLFLLVGAVIVGGLAVFGLFGGEVSTQNQQSGNTPAIQAEEVSDVDLKTFAGIGTLEELQGLGTNVECTISYEAPELEQPVNGTYFVSGENIRGDFELFVPEFGGSSLSSVIFTRDMFYSWSEIVGETYGVKMSVDMLNGSDGTGAQEPVPPDVDVAYDCIEWVNVDLSIFEPPSNVLFRDVSQLLQGGMEYGTVYEEGEF